MRKSNHAVFGAAALFSKLTATLSVYVDARTQNLKSSHFMAGRLGMEMSHGTAVVPFWLVGQIV